jgi:hypothetical protein
MSSDFKRQPSTFPGENDSGQTALLGVSDDSVDANVKKWRKKKKYPTKKIYQLGVDTPIYDDTKLRML